MQIRLDILQKVLYSSRMDNKLRMRKVKTNSEEINPEGAIVRGFLKENVRIFPLRGKEHGFIPLHYHEFHKMIFFESGKTDYIVEGKRYHLMPGDVLIIPAFSIHQPVFTEGVPYKRTVLWIKPQAAEEMGLSATFKRAGIQGRTDPDTEMDSLVQEVMEYISENLTEDIYIEDLCEKFFISKSRLTERFRLATGVTPHKYLVQKRLALATQLISEGATIGDAARNSGFGDYSTFYRAFKKEFSSAPDWERK